MNKSFISLFILSLWFVFSGFAVAQSLNRAPELEFIGDKTIELGEEFVFIVFASDPDGDFVSYDISILPPGATFKEFEGVGKIYYIFKWTPVYTQRGTYSVTFFAEDSNGAADLETINLIVREAVSDEDIIAPFISDVAVVDRTGNSAIISWTTNELSVGKIEYGTSADYGQQTIFTDAFKTKSRQSIEGLEPGTLYRYRVVAKDEAGNESFSGEKSFSTISLEEVGKVDLRIRIADSQLARVEGNARVYYITKRGLKKWIRNQEIFSSYKDNKWENVVVVSPGDLDIYPEVNLIVLAGDYKVYNIEGDTKRWIKTAEAFNRFGYNWNNILSVNSTEFSFYKDGSPIE